MGWIIQHEIPEQAALGIIRSQAKLPAALIFVSGNDETIERIADAISTELGTALCTSYEILEPGSLPALPQEMFAVDHYAIVKVLHGYSSVMKFRHQIVETLRDRGAKTVIMIWIKGNPEHDNPNACAVNEELRRHPPTPDGIDYLFTLEP